MTISRILLYCQTPHPLWVGPIDTVFLIDVKLRNILNTGPNDVKGDAFLLPESSKSKALRGLF